MKNKVFTLSLLVSVISSSQSGFAQNGEAKAFLPSYKMLERPFCKADQSLFANPPSVFYPEIWVECLNGNLSKEGILADLEAIHEAGFSGVQMFFGNQGGAWPA